MKEQNEWIPYKELDLNDKEYNVFSIDTRDFHSGYRFEKNNHPDYETIKNYPHFFHTEEEIWQLLDRYFEESGGKGKWRFFMIEGMDNWNMKYIRIWRTDLGFVVCNSKHQALSKQILNAPVSMEHLNFIN